MPTCPRSVELYRDNARQAREIAPWLKETMENNRILIRNGLSQRQRLKAATAAMGKTGQSVPLPSNRTRRAQGPFKPFKLNQHLHIQARKSCSSKRATDYLTSVRLPISSHVRLKQQILSSHGGHSLSQPNFTHFIANAKDGQVIKQSHTHEHGNAKARPSITIARIH